MNDVKIAEDKKLDDLVSALGELALNEPCMKGACDAFFNEIKREPKNVNGRGFPGAGKSVLAISIVIRLQNQKCDIVAVRPYIVCYHHYRCPLARCRLWSRYTNMCNIYETLQGGCAAHRQTDEHASAKPVFKP